MVEPSFAERSLIYHKDYLNDATIVTSSAVNITEDAVLTHSDWPCFDFSCQQS
jgi:hypothetical protein